MNVAKWLLYALLMLPLAEIAAFIAVAAAVGFLCGAGAASLAGSFAGALILRRAGGNHIARMRVGLGDNRLTALQADGAGTAHPAGRLSAVDSGVYHRPAGASAADCRRCAGRSARRCAARRAGAARRRGRSRARAVAPGSGPVAADRPERER